MRKKKVLFHSNYCGAPTGFGGVMLEILTYLYKTGKYDLYLYAAGMTWDHPDYARYPWKVYGTLPMTQQEIDALNRDPHQSRLASYGAMNIDKVIKEVKPDVYFAQEDWWAQNYALDKPYWNKINCAINWTADSLPLLEDAVNNAHKVKNHYVWADFARKEFHRLGHTNVKTLRGSVDIKGFYKLPEHKKKELRKQHGISDDAYLVGSGSRNQLRKLFVNVIEGFKMFKNENPESKAKLTFFCDYREGWNLPRACQEFGVDLNDVLCVYKCRTTEKYYLLPYKGQDIDSPEGHSKSMVTVGVNDKLSISQINEWLNMLDVFTLPVTSGGQELWWQQAKAVELVTLINPYSCGEDNCVPEAYSLPIDFATYREQGTQFIKATVYSSSIAKQLKKHYKMDKSTREEWGKKARQWVIDNFSIDVIGKQYEEILDAFDFTTYDFDFDPKPKNANAIIPEIKDDIEWVKTLYKDILDMQVANDDSGLIQWTEQLKNGGQRDKIEAYFRSVANQENDKNKKVEFSDTLAQTGKKRVINVIQESAGDCLFITSLLPSMRRRYPKDEWDLYIATKPEYKNIFDGNDNVDYVIDYIPQMDSLIWLEGQHENKGYFDVAYLPFIGSQRMLNYMHNSSDLLDFKIKE